MLVADVKDYCKREIKSCKELILCFSDVGSGKELKDYYSGQLDAYQELLAWITIGKFPGSELPFPEVEK